MRGTTQAEEALEGQEGVAAEPRGEAVHIATERDERAEAKASAGSQATGVGQTSDSVGQEVSVVIRLEKQEAHTLEHPVVDVARFLAKVGVNDATDTMAIDDVMLIVHLLHLPDVSGDGNLAHHGRRLDDGAKFFGIAADGVFLILTEDGVELIVVDDTLASQTDKESTAVGALDVVDLEQVEEQGAEVVLRNIAEGRQRQDTRSQLGRQHLATRRQRGHRLMIEQTVGQSAFVRRLDPAILQIELHHSNALEQLPRDRLREQSARLRVILPHDEPHFGRCSPATRTPHALEEGRNGGGGIDLESAFKPTDVNA